MLNLHTSNEAGSVFWPLCGFNIRVSLVLNLLPVVISAGLCGLGGICNEAYIYEYSLNYMQMKFKY